MKLLAFVVNHDEIIASIYKHEKFGVVVVFRTPKIDLEFSLFIHPIDNESVSSEEQIDLLNLVLDSMPVGIRKNEQHS